MIVTDENDKKQLPSETTQASGSTPASSPGLASGSHFEASGSTILNGPSSPASETAPAPPAYAESPPVYTPSPGGGLASDPGSQYGNHYIIKREFGELRGTFMIDPCLIVPSVMLPNISPGGVHPNLEARTHLGSINVDLHIVAKQPFNGRAIVDLSTELGNATVRLHESSVPLSLNVTTEIGTLSLAIPRNFRGMISQATEIGRNILSPDVREITTSRSDVRGHRRLFIGDPQGPGWANNGETWTGHEIILRAQIGGINVSFMDEPQDLRSGWTRFATSLM
jgi:hypothetical protein